MAEGSAARPGFRIAVAWALFGVFVLVATFVSLRQREPDEVLPVSRSDGEALLSETVRLAQAGDFTKLCQTIATSEGICGFLLDGARQAGRAPGPAGPEIVRVTDTAVDRLVFHLRGVRADGSSYTSDFPVTRDESGDLRSHTPVYWSGVRLDDSISCTSSPGRFECSGIAVPPVQTAPSR